MESEGRADEGSAAVVLTAVLAGCGGGPEGPSAEKRAALDRWTRTADAACEKANDAIAERGWPVDLVDLDRLTVRAITDIEAASKAIRAQKPPAGSKEKVQPFVQSLEELDATMKQLSTATERFKIARLDKFLPKLGGSLQKVETRVEGARAPRVRGQRRAHLRARRGPRPGLRAAASRPGPQADATDQARSMRPLHRRRPRATSASSATSRTPTRAGSTTS